VNLLIDENLTPSLVQRFAAKGVAAAHVAHIGMPGASDPEVWKYAFEHDQIVVTINAADFLHLAHDPGSLDKAEARRPGEWQRRGQWTGETVHHCDEPARTTNGMAPRRAGTARPRHRVRLIRARSRCARASCLTTAPPAGAPLALGRRMYYLVGGLHGSIGV
jgi:hypothetical protein